MTKRKKGNDQSLKRSRQPGSVREKRKLAKKLRHSGKYTRQSAALRALQQRVAEDIDEADPTHLQ